MPASIWGIFMKYLCCVIRKLKRQTIIASVFIALGCWTPSYALGPVDGELILSLWNNQFESDLLEGDVDVGSLTASGELWIGDNWGLRLARYENDLEETEFENQSRLQFELRRRLLSISDNNFLAFGVGAEKIDLLNGESTSGLRLSAEARVAFTPITYLYARGALLPAMEDAGGFQDITGKEIEVGLSFTPLPFLSIKAGYLTLDLDYENSTTGAGGSTRSDGLLIGAGIHW